MSSKAQTQFERAAGGPVLVFFTRRTSGPARRMESLIAHYAQKERGRLHVAVVDVDDHDGLVRKYAVRKVPTLVLVKGDEPIGRIVGRATGTQIEELIHEHLR